MNTERILQTKECFTCKQTFPIYENDRKFLEVITPLYHEKKYTLPLPDNCPKCRRQYRLAWRNMSKLFRRKCDLSWKEILSFYTEQAKHPVYEISLWDGNEWNPLEYGRSFDFSRSFFEQFGELKSVVPHPSRSILRLENSEYSNNASDIKNCYLCFGGGHAEDCYYDINFKDIQDCVDCYDVDWCEHCYNSVDIENCNTVFYTQDSKGCNNSSFLKNCYNCTYCFGCINLTWKTYHIFNKSYSKDEYQTEITRLLSVGLDTIKKQVQTFYLQFPEKYIHWLQYENVTGDYINASRDIFESFYIIDSENIRYCTDIKEQSKNLMDVDIFWWWLENCYESVVIWHNSNKIYFSYDCWDNIYNILYCSTCMRNISNCFGCVGLHDGYEYCILNTQYTKEEYEELVPKIIEHMMKTEEWGRFFPPKLSSYGYNETEWIYSDPLSQKEAKKYWFNWSDYEAPFPTVDKIIPAKKIPDDISKIPDDILNWAIECEVTKKPFRIIKQELDFYRKHNLPIPRRHPDQRHLDRMALRNPRKLYERVCDKCGKDMITTYAPERPEMVYCEECYNRDAIE